jgi:hypothetical protein
MTDWATALVPVAALAVGSLLTMLGQSLTDRRAYRREREARYHDFRIRRFEIERDTLLELQDKLLLLTDRRIALNQADLGSTTSEAAKSAYMTTSDEVLALASRCLDNEARETTLKYRYLCNRAEATGAEYHSAINAIGEALRRDPLDPAAQPKPAAAATATPSDSPA